MRHPGDDVIERRLRAAGPPEADAGVDLELLRRVMAQPDPPAPSRRRGRVALPVAAVAVVAAAVAFVGAGPSKLGGPTGARAAMARSLHWFDPPAGTILHVRSEMTSRGAGTLTQESWQSVDHPAQGRRAEPGVETDATGALYDVAANTIYAWVPPPKATIRQRIETAIAAKIKAARAAGAGPEVIARLRRDRRTILRGLVVKRRPAAPTGPETKAGDALVNQMRGLLRSGEATVGEETVHDGVAAFPITFSPGSARWTMWARADDGRPLELRIDGTDPVAPGLETVRWPVYEVASGDQADRLLTVAGAHPDARVVRSAQAWQDALQRLYPHG
jgi:hypothetical protein